MDIFKDNRQSNIRWHQVPPENQFHSLHDQQWMHPIIDERLPVPERSIDLMTNVVKRIIMFVLFIAVLATVICVLFPALRTIYQFSKWAFRCAGNLFP